MSSQYSLKRFLRQSPNRFLKQYFISLGILSEIDFDILKETDAETIFSAWLNLPEEIKSTIEKDFREIDELANAIGSKAIRDEAFFHKEDLLEKFFELKGFHEHAFWTFLERPAYWRGALDFHHADIIPASYWRKRKNLPKKPAAIDSVNIESFEKALGNYFYTIQGRGKNCKVDCYKRNELDYFYVYAEDFTQSSMEWDKGQFERRAHHPAFEIIFAFSEREGALDTYLLGDRKIVPDLQAIFAEKLLKTELAPDAQDDRVYDLEPLRLREFQFVYDLGSNIEKVVIKKLRLSISGKKKEKIVLETDGSYDRNAIFDLYEKTTKEFLPLQIFISQVGIKVTFFPNASSRKPKTRTFEITWPNSCNLKHDGYDLHIRKMLVSSGIEPREPAKEIPPHD